MNSVIISKKLNIKKFDVNGFSKIDDEVYKEVFNLEKDYMKKYDSLVFSLIYKVVDSFDNSVSVNDSVELKHLKLFISQCFVSILCFSIKGRISFLLYLLF